MPRVVFTEGAAQGLDRCRRFLSCRSAPASRRAAEVIARHFALLETTPEMGRPFPLDPALRELPILFGDSGYVALYRHEPADDLILILAFRHQKEAGY